MNGIEKMAFLSARYAETVEAFKNENDADKYHALELLEQTVQRIKAAVLADICISDKAYPALTNPWISGGERE